MNVNTAVAAYQAKHPTINGRPDQNLIDALQKVSPQAQAKTRKQVKARSAIPPAPAHGARC
jgi:flagellar protein FlgJ